jgi:hypothetical protein
MISLSRSPERRILKLHLGKPAEHVERPGRSTGDGGFASKG